MTLPSGTRQWRPITPPADQSRTNRLRASRGILAVMALVVVAGGVGVLVGTQLGRLREPAAAAPVVARTVAPAVTLAPTLRPVSTSLPTPRPTSAPLPVAVGDPTQAPEPPPTLAPTEVSTLAPTPPPPPPPPPTPTIAPTAAPAVAAATDDQTFIIGQSVEGRDIVATRLGSGPVVVALIGNIHGGWEPVARQVVEQARSYFLAHPEEVPPQVTLYFIPTVNPDGFAHGLPLQAAADGTGGPGDVKLAPTAFNAHGVDLNRNFPVNWSSHPCGGEKYRLQFGDICKEGAAGPQPFSEPETQAYRDFVLSHHVRLAYTYHEDNFPSVSIRDGGGGRSEPLVHDLAALFTYPYIKVWTKYPVTGQAQDWLDAQGILGTEIELRYRTLDWDHNLAAIKLAFHYALESL